MVDVADLPDYFTAAEAAEELNVSAARVRALIDARVLDGRKVAGRWLVSPESVHARQINQRRSGRLLSSRYVWELINSGFIAQLLAGSDEAARQNIRVQLSSRAEIHDVYVLPRLAKSIGPLVMPGGRALAESANVAAGNDPRWQLDAYLRRDVFAELRDAKRISAAQGEPNTRLRIVEADMEWHESRTGRLLVAWLDLADDGDRAADVTLQALVDELRRAEIEPFPVAADAVARVSLGVLAALNDELSA